MCRTRRVEPDNDPYHEARNPRADRGDRQQDDDLVPRQSTNRRGRVHTTADYQWYDKPELTGRLPSSILPEARSGAPPVRGKGASSHPSSISRHEPSSGLT